MRSWMTSMAMVVACGAAARGQAQDSDEAQVRFFVGGTWYEHRPRPLSANAAYLFEKVIPLETKALTDKKAADTLTEVEEARLEEYAAMTRIWNRYQFLDRILRGDAKVAEEAAHLKDYHLRVRVGERGKDGRCRIGSEVVDPQYVLQFGNRVLVVGEEKEQKVASTSIITIREGSRKQIEDYTKVYLARVRAWNMLEAVRK